MRASAAADGADDLDPISGLEGRVAKAAFRHDFSIALDGDPLAFKRKVTDQVGDGGPVSALAHGAVDDNGEHGEATTGQGSDERLF
jgi:hypothetical protein